MNHRHAALPILLSLLAGCGGEPEAPRSVADGSAAPPAAVADPCAAGSGERLLHVPSPDWRDQVVYMVFTDRFHDGDPLNNDLGHGEFDAASPSHFNGGDFQGIVDRIPYLQELGVTAIWQTPPVLNQWWSTPYQAAGWHGYWAVNFMEVDPHFGTLESYRDLSHQLHCNGMYLIQDIVINHTGNFYAWNGPFDPDNRGENFYLVEEGLTEQVAPTQFPFDKIDVRDPEHREIGAYHWYPELNDYNDPYQMNYYGFGLLADTNTENPLVIDTFKDSYRHWIEEVGVDGFRIDTVIYVDPPFWHRFLHDDDGVYEAAAATGRDHFITFGEVLVPSEPFKTDGEEKILRFFGTEEEPGLNSLLGFPLYFSIRRVLSEGQPAAQLAYRLDQHMVQYPDPYVIPTFIDNHDTARFLASGGLGAYRQALALVFTIPGLPIVYQGTEQAMTVARPALYEDGGALSGSGRFDTDSEAFRLVRDLIALRRGHRVFTRGSMEVLAGDEFGAGLLAYRREYEGERVVVLMNTAEHSTLVNRLDAGVGPNRVLEPMFALNHEGVLATDADGMLNLKLPARAVLVLRDSGAGEAQAAEAAGATITFDAAPGDEPLESNFVLTGTISEPGAALSLIVNGNLDTATSFTAGDDGSWRVELPVRDLGEASNYLQLYAPDFSALSEQLRYQTLVEKPTIEIRVDDPVGDDTGPTGEYVVPLQPASGRQKDIVSASVRAAGRNLELSLTMQEHSDVWTPLNGFDNVAFSTFISLPGREGVRILPQIDANMPEGLSWDLAHVASGWVSYTYTSENATADRQGVKLGTSPDVSADKASRTIRFFYRGDRLGVDDWRGATIYVTTWDLEAEGAYTKFRHEPAQWFFSGAGPGDPKILDDLLIRLPEE